MRPLKDIGLAVLSGVVYFSLRNFFHHLIRSAGYFDGSLLSYDSYYPFAFAQELARTGKVLLFHNPFGTLDKAPRLFNLFARAFSATPTRNEAATLFLVNCLK
jgi:hypothetical protein